MKLDWQRLDRLSRRFGDSFYLLDLEAFKTNWNEFLGSVRQIYPKSNFAYSYKTNYIPRLCRLVNEWAGYAEVVSHMEFDLARRIDVPPCNILYNGPYKRVPDIKAALISGAVLNLDAFYEIDIIRSLAAKHPGHSFRIGFRCNFDIGSPERSRFGFDAETGQLALAVSRIREIENCRIAGIQCHFLTPRRSLADYSRIARTMIRIAARQFEGIPLDFIDIGGGFMSRMSGFLKKQFPFPVPVYTEYADAVAPHFAEAFPGGTGPELILEPGISVTADIMKFAARVIDIKQIGNQLSALVSGSIYNIKPTKSLRNLPMTLHRKPGGTGDLPTGRPMNIVGYTCMEDDILFHDCEESIDPGDFAVFDNVGAYTVVLKPPFIMPCPPILGCGSDPESVETVKQQENMTDVFRTYTF